MAKYNLLKENSGKRVSFEVLPFDKDCYETSHKTLDPILNALDPKRYYLFEPFPGSGYSTEYMRSKGFIVTNGDHADFFNHTKLPSIPEGVEGQELFLVTNPPFSSKKKVMLKLKELGVENMALLLPSGTLFLKYWPVVFPQENFQVLFKQGRCKFLNPNTHELIKGSCSFDVCWATHNLNLTKSISYF